MVHVPFLLKLRAVANVSSMNCQNTIFPSRTLAWMANGDRTTFPMETERSVNEPKTATSSPALNMSVTVNSSIVHNFKTCENVKMNASGDDDVPAYGKICLSSASS